jgi:hypothetical protein
MNVCCVCVALWRLQDLRDRTYYLSNGVIRVGGRRVATNAANFTKGDTVGCVLDADQVRRPGLPACVAAWAAGLAGGSGGLAAAALCIDRAPRAPPEPCLHDPYKQ